MNKPIKSVVEMEKPKSKSLSIEHRELLSDSHIRSHNSSFGTMIDIFKDPATWSKPKPQ